MQIILFAALAAAAPADVQPPVAPPPPVCPADAAFCFAGPQADPPPGRRYTASVVGYMPAGPDAVVLVRLGYGELTYSDGDDAADRNEPHRFGEVRDLFLSFVRRF